MKRSDHRILTTHSGSLVRTREIIEGMKLFFAYGAESRLFPHNPVLHFI